MKSFYFILFYFNYVSITYQTCYKFVKIIQTCRGIVRPEKFQFMEKGQKRNFDYKIVITVKKFVINSLDLG